jgi:hypothetical protein
MEVYKKMNLTPHVKILFLEIRPGEFQLIAKNKAVSQKSWARSLAGKYPNDSIDGVQSLLDDRKTDLELEERGYH